MNSSKRINSDGLWIPRDIWLLDISDKAKALLAIIDSQDKGCFLSNAELANLIQLSEGRLANILTELRKDNYIVGERHKSGISVNWLRFKTYDLITIDQHNILEYGITTTQEILYSYMRERVKWANTKTINGVIWFSCPVREIINALPILTDKPDTIYRMQKSLKDKGLVQMIKIEGEDYYKID